MELDVAKLVAFAIATESNEGVMGKSPRWLKDQWSYTNVANSIEQLREMLDEEYIHVWDNYLTVWEAAGGPEAPAPEAKAAAHPPISWEEAAKELEQLGLSKEEINAKLGTPVEEAQEPSEAAVIFEALKPVLDVIKESEPKKQRGKHK